MTTEDTPLEGGRETTVGPEDFAPLPEDPPECALAWALHGWAVALRTATRAADRWEEAGRPLGDLGSLHGPARAWSESIALLARREEAASQPLPDFAVELERAVRPLAEAYPESLPEDLLTELCGGPVVLAAFDQIRTFFAHHHDPALGIAADWAELHDLVVARLRRNPDMPGTPFRPDITECYLAEELLAHAQRWVDAGRPDTPNEHDAVCVAWLAERRHYLPEQPEGGGERPPMSAAHTLDILLTDPAEVCLEDLESVPSPSLDGPENSPA